MKYNEILALLDKGLTPDQIMNLAEAPSPAEQLNPEPVQEIETAIQSAPVQEQAPEWATQLNANIQRMTNALHANAILNAQQPDVAPMTAEDALAAIIAPPAKKG